MGRASYEVTQRVVSYRGPQGTNRSPGSVRKDPAEDEIGVLQRVDARRVNVPEETRRFREHFRGDPDHVRVS